MSRIQSFTFFSKEIARLLFHIECRVLQFHNEDSEKHKCEQSLPTNFLAKPEVYNVRANCPDFYNRTYRYDKLLTKLSPLSIFYAVKILT